MRQRGEAGDKAGKRRSKVRDKVGDMMEDEVGDKGAHKLGDKDIRRQSRGYKGIKKRRTKSETIGGQSGAKRGANRRTLEW